MGRRFRQCIFSLVYSPFLLTGPSLSAQVPTARLPQRNYLEFEGVGTLANGSLEGQTSDRHLFFAGISYQRLLIENRVVALRFSSEAIPLAILREPFLIGCGFDPISRQCVAQQTPRSFPAFTRTGTSYGTGASPIGLEVSLLPFRKIQPYFGIQGGFLYFNRNVLNVNAAQFNFTIDGRSGMRFSLGNGKAISFAYMFHHMSNHDIAVANPGMDSHMLSVAYSFPFHWFKGH